MKKTTYFISSLSLAVIMIITYACTKSTNNDNVSDKINGSEYVSSRVVDQLPFPDFGFMLSPKVVIDSSFPVFKLSQDYPKDLPNNPEPVFFTTDFKKDWRKYLLEVQKYCFEGNTDIDFRVENNMTRSWYHMPWQHYSVNGREGFHGLTKEAPVKAKQLSEAQSFDTGGAWAVGFFNDLAGYTIGQVWKNHSNPDVKAMGSGFKNGAVLFKLLFLSMPPSLAEKQVPFLQNGIWWDAYATYNFACSDDRKHIKVALIQMDVMIRDDRALNGWIFGNFQYNGKMNKDNKWENLVPVGIMWGQDPDNNTNTSNPDPVKTIINTKLLETVINPDTNELPPTHLGWNGRLNGPVDNPMSSCFSCHATAEYPQGSPISPLFDKDSASANPPGSEGWMRWFSNLKCGTAFDNPEEHHSTDFCLQMAESIQNFTIWKDNESGLYYSDYEKTPNTLRAAPSVTKSPAKKVFPLGRRNM